MKNYGFGIIGLGVMGQEMAELLTAHPRFHVVAGFDPARPAVPFPLLADAAAVVNDPRVDAIYTATPPAHHEAIVRLAAAAKKPIFCEKPLSSSPPAMCRCASPAW
jgi:predicted dehydrogenase